MGNNKRQEQHPWPWLHLSLHSEKEIEAPPTLFATTLKKGQLLDRYIYICFVLRTQQLRYVF
jgi:hypothetical protein